MDISNKMKPLLSEDEIQAKIKEIAAKINFNYLDQEICVICVLKGSVMFCADLIKRLNCDIKLEFIRLSSYGSSVTSSGKVNAVDISLPDLNGKNVLIVEDIVDTGLTAKFLLDFLQNNFRTKSTRLCSLLDKKCKRKVEIDADYVGFEIDDKFVVGYGLDYDGLYRNLPYIAYVEE